MSIRAALISCVLCLFIGTNANAVTIAAFGDSNTAQAWSWQYYVAQNVAGYQGAAFWDPASNTTQMIARVKQALGSMSTGQIANNYFVIDGGAADINAYGFNGYGKTLSNYDTMVSLLSNAGAQHIVVMNFFDLMALPVSDAAHNPNTQATRNWIGAVNGGLVSRYASNSSVSIFDLHTVIDSILQNPSSYGVSMGTCSSGCFTVDGSHLGREVNRSIGNAFIAAELTPVPVPAAGWLFGSSVLSLAAVARRKKNAALR